MLDDVPQSLRESLCQLLNGRAAVKLGAIRPIKPQFSVEDTCVHFQQVRPPVASRTSWANRFARQAEDGSGFQHAVYLAQVVEAHTRLRQRAQCSGQLRLSVRVTQ